MHTASRFAAVDVFHAGAPDTTGVDFRQFRYYGTIITFADVSHVSSPAP